VARNRKRAKERRARRPQTVTNRIEREVERVEREVGRVVHNIDALDEDAPNPITHGTPDVELAEAQVALGRPELTHQDADEPEVQSDEDGGSPSSVAVAERRAAPGSRLVNFLQGSWRELQRVQWPDRRQVMQATGVVIGFVIVAGVFLGVADFVAGKLMNFVLK